MEFGDAVRTEAGALWRAAWPWSVLLAGELFVRSFSTPSRHLHRTGTGRAPR
jgi:hypothetical protein